MKTSAIYTIGTTIACVFIWASQGPDLPDIEEGEDVYLTRCMSCHMVDGRGIAGVFPPLIGTEWVSGDKGRLIRVVLDGVSGPMEVQGMTYGGVMPGWKAFLSDEEVAAVLTYIRESFGNEASAVTEEEVSVVRDATKARSKPWTTDELNQAANQGIPGGQ